MLAFVLGAAATLIGIWFAVSGGLTIDIPQTVDAATRQAVPSIVRTKYAAIIYQTLRSSLYLLCFWLAAFGYGFALTKWLCPNCISRRRTQMIVGLTSMLMLTWVVSWTIGTSGPIVWGINIIGIGLFGYQLKNAKQRERLVTKPDLPWSFLLLFLVAGLMMTAACCPPVTMWRVEAYGYDVTSYHLQLPREWLAMGHLQGLTHNVYSFLPSLAEVGYLHISAMVGSVYQAIIVVQILHVTTAWLAASLAAGIVSRIAGPTISWCCAAVILTTPWTIVTSTLAYNEWFAIAMGAGALLIVLENGSLSWRTAILAGMLVGGATMVKLTAGPNLAVPLGVLLLVGLLRDESEQFNIPRQIRAAGIAAILGFVMLCPYFARNGLQTGNPVFPFAASVFGTGSHWTEHESKRWADAHAAEEATTSERIRKLGQHWFCNTGYGAIFGKLRQRGEAGKEAQNIARFDREWGFPLLWLIVLICSGLALSGKPTRRLATAMLAALAIQLIFWLYGTHLQARFLIWSLLPGVVLIGLGAHRVTLWNARLSIPVAVGCAIVAGIMTISSYNLFYSQKVGGKGNLATWMVVDSLPEPSRFKTLRLGDVLAGDHAINYLPQNSKTLLIADASRMLYIRNEVVYNSAFDRNVLGDVVRAVGDDPNNVLSELKNRGITHIWLHFSEFNRLTATYGYDPDVTDQLLKQLLATGRLRLLYELPEAQYRPPGRGIDLALYSIQ